MNVQCIDWSTSQRKNEATSDWIQYSLKNQVKSGLTLGGKSSPSLGCFEPLLQGILVAKYSKNSGRIQGKKAPTLLKCLRPFQQGRRNTEHNQNTSIYSMSGLMPAGTTSHINMSVRDINWRTQRKLEATFDWIQYFPKNQRGSMTSSPLRCFGPLLQRNLDTSYSKNSECMQGRKVPPLLKCFKSFLQRKRSGEHNQMTSCYSMTQDGRLMTLYGPCLQRTKIAECNLLTESFGKSQHLQGRLRFPTFSPRKVIAGYMLGQRHNVTIKVLRFTIRL